jgi:hypothetical protein
LGINVMYDMKVYTGGMHWCLIIYLK